MSATPLLDRIKQRKPRSVVTIIRSWHPGDPKPVGVTKLRIPRNTPPFARRKLLRAADEPTAFRRLPAAREEFYNGAAVPDGDRGAA